MPLLMSGAGVGDIFRALGGAGQGAATMDGLRSMMSSSLMNANMYYPMRQNASTLNRAFETVVDRLGVNPYTNGGQSAVSMLRAAYSFAPDIVGGIAGIPNTGKFYSTIANGAGGISMAAGYGMPDFANPYSVMGAHRRAVNISRAVHDLAINENGGYRVDYTHGMNMDELGRVSQRLLSSRIAYRDVETGASIDPNTEADKFKGNLKKLGTKFNEAVSMLSKVTGSVDEALRVMDRLGGGNFLGGTAEQASSIANRAKRMAANIRIMSAAAGMSPTEVYQNMSGLMTNMAGGMGMSSYVAAASGFTGLMHNMAYNASAGYAAWRAMNAGATPDQQAAALLAVNGRAQAYASSNGARLASLVADNMGMFSEDQLARIKKAYAEGTPNDVAGMIRGVVGDRLYTEHMRNQSFNIASRNRASKNAESNALLEELDMSGLSSNLDQAERVGARRMLGIYTNDLDSALERRTGKRNLRQERYKTVRDDLARELVGKGVLTEEMAKDLNIDQLRQHMTREFGGDYAERFENNSVIAESVAQIRRNTMDAEEENGAIGRISELANRMNLTQQTKDKINDLAKSDGEAAMFRLMEFAKTQDERESIRKQVSGGKFFGKGAERMIGQFDRIRKQQSGELDDEERIAALENDLKKKALTESLDLKGAAEKDLKKYNELVEEAVGSDNVRALHARSAKRVLDEIVGDKLGGLDENELKEFKARVSGGIADALMDGGDAKAALIAELNSLKNSKGGQDAADVEKLIRQIESGDKDASNTAFRLSSASTIDEIVKKKRNDAVGKIRELAKNGFEAIQGGPGLDGLFDALKDTWNYDQGALDKAREKANAEYSGGKDVREVARGALAELQKGVKNDSYFGMTATNGADKAGILMAAMMYRAMGGDVKALGLSDSAVNAISELDKSNAAAKMNNMSNFWGSGGVKFADEAIKFTEDRVSALREMLAGVDEKTIKGAVGGNEGDLKTVREALKNSKHSEKDFALLKSLVESNGDFEQSVLGSITGKDGSAKSLEDAKKKDEKGYREKMLDVARKTGQNESQAYAIMNELSEFLTKASRFFNKPDMIFNVRIADIGR